MYCTSKGPTAFGSRCGRQSLTGVLRVSTVSVGLVATAQNEQRKSSAQWQAMATTPSL
jgi:hypothetical protein